MRECEKSLNLSPGSSCFPIGGKREDTGDEVEKSFLASVTSYSLLESEKELSNCLYR